MGFLLHLNAVFVARLFPRVVEDAGALCGIDVIFMVSAEVFYSLKHEFCFPVRVREKSKVIGTCGVGNGDVAYFCTFILSLSLRRSGLLNLL